MSCLLEMFQSMNFQYLSDLFLFHHLAHLLNPIVCVHNEIDHIQDITTDSHTNHIEYISNKLFITFFIHIHMSLDPSSLEDKEKVTDN